MSISKSFSVFFVIILFIILFEKSNAGPFKREVTVLYNPDCPPHECAGKGVNIFYAKASSSNDVLHYIFSAGYVTKTLSVIILRSLDLHAVVTINYTNWFKNKIDILKFNGKTDGVFGFVFTKLYEYNDNHDTADMEGDKWTTFTFDQFNWNASLVNNKIITFKADNSKVNDSLSILSRGNIEIKFNVGDEFKHGDSLPRLLFTGNNTQFDFILNTLNTTYPNSRFGVEFALINKLNIGEMKIETKRSLDDENSPGVFQIKNFYGQDPKSDWKHSTYVQWKPVCYLSETDRSLNNISLTKNFPPKAIDSENSRMSIERSLAYMYMGDSIFQANSTMKLMNITFGMPKDKFYKNMNYLIWTSSFGQGTPVIDGLSTMVIMVIAFGLGLPFVLVVVGSIYLVVKKRMNKRLKYEIIEDPIN